MPSLPTAALGLALEKFLDPDADGFVAPTTEDDAINLWAGAITACMSLILIAPPNLGALAGAVAAKDALAGMSDPDKALEVIPAAFDAFAAEIVSATLPTHTSVAPVPPITLVLPNTGDAQAVITTIQAAVDLWLLTGISSLKSPPAPVLGWK